MFRTGLEPGRGMPFVLPRPERLALGMRDTLVPLSGVFIDDHGIITNVNDMESRTDTMHWSSSPVRHAL